MGKFIVFEGMDGCGKGTQLFKATTWLRSLGKTVYVTEEPSRRFFRDIIKQAIKVGGSSPQLTALLFAADRLHHIEKEIVPELQKNSIVISDRYYHSSYTYQALECGDLQWVMSINKFAIKPDLTIIFDVTPELAVERITQAGRPTSEAARYEKQEFLRQVREKYINLKGILPEENIISLDSSKPIEEVFEKVKESLQKLVQ